MQLQDQNQPLGHDLRQLEGNEISKVASESNAKKPNLLAETINHNPTKNHKF